ncbi:MAG: GNAT superfamily N-acetyltransferase [Cyclobacteriaceae bacterium]
MEKVIINGKVYGYVVNYKSDTSLRNSFNRLTRKIYHFDFEGWYQNGYWSDRYIPYSIADGTNIVANVSVNVIDFIVGGMKRTSIQIGTVMTDEDYRHQGLNRFLLEKVLAEWRGKCDLIYLFANDSVLNFYPKFGFKPAEEYQHSLEIKSGETTANFTQLNMSDKEEEKFLYQKVKQSTQFSQLSMDDNASLVMFYCTSFMSEDVYFSKELAVIAIATYDDHILYIKDIFCEKEIAIKDVISALTNEKITRVVLGFTPKERDSFDENIFQQDDTLFVLDDKWGLFKNSKMMFPILSHA